MNCLLCLLYVCECLSIKMSTCIRLIVKITFCFTTEIEVIIPTLSILHSSIYYINQNVDSFNVLSNCMVLENRLIFLVVRLDLCGHNFDSHWFDISDMSWSS